MRASASRWPRIVTRATAGMTAAPRDPWLRLRQRTGTPATSRSTGAGSDLDHHGRAQRLSQPHRGVGHADGRRRRGRVRSCRRFRAARSSPSPTSRTWLSGPTISTVAGSAVIRPTTNPGAGSPSVAGTIGTVAAPTSRASSDNRRRHHLRDFDAVRHADLVGPQVEQPRAGARVRQVEHRDDFARIEAAQLRRRSAHAHVDGRRQVADDLERPGRFRTASGTRRLRSTTCSPATVSHSTLASAIARTFSPRWRNGMVGHQ